MRKTVNSRWWWRPQTSNSQARVPWRPTKEIHVACSVQAAPLHVRGTFSEKPAGSSSRYVASSFSAMKWQGRNKNVAHTQKPRPSVVGVSKCTRTTTLFGNNKINAWRPSYIKKKVNRLKDTILFNMIVIEKDTLTLQGQWVKSIKC